MEMDRPTFVFSIGAWVSPIVFDAVRDRLNTLLILLNASRPPLSALSRLP